MAESSSTSGRVPLTLVPFLLLFLSLKLAQPFLIIIALNVQCLVIFDVMMVGSKRSVNEVIVITATQPGVIGLFTSTRRRLMHNMATSVIMWF
jgi:hypothetical protein